MRLNIYAEEVTSETQIVTKTVTDDEFGSRTFYGLRFFLASPDVLHHSHDDDDRSAVTIWCRWTAKGGHDFGTVANMLDNMQRDLTYAIGEALRTTSAAQGAGGQQERDTNQP